MVAIKERRKNAVATVSRYEALGLTKDDLINMYYTIVLSRLLDERMWVLNRQGVAPFVVSCQGHEGAQIGSAWALKPGEDFVLPYYRDLGVALCFGMTPREVMLGLLARGGDPCSGGKQMPAHYGYPRLKIISGSSPVATQIPHAAGIALATKIRREKAVAVAYFGDGATSKGDFHEGINFASVHKLPVIFFCENNGYAISVPLHKQMAVANVADRAFAYGIPGVTVDGGDVLAVYGATQEAVARARAGEGPTLIEAKVPRLTSHSSDEDEKRYRSPEEMEAARKMDPVVRFRQYLMDEGLLTEEMDKSIREEIMKEVDDATDYAINSSPPAPEEALTHVYAD